MSKRSSESALASASSPMKKYYTSTTTRCSVNGVNNDNLSSASSPLSSTSTPNSNSSSNTIPSTAKVVCPKCFGEGKIPSRLTKKSKLQYQKMKQLFEEQQKRILERGGREIENEKIISIPKPQRSMKNCNFCSGSGIVSASALAQVPSSKRNHQNLNIDPNVHISIIGGGIGGLALAIALQHRSIPFTIYEKDLNFDERQQGYGLTMQQGSQALLALGLYKEQEDDNQGGNNQGDGNQEDDNQRDDSQGDDNQNDGQQQQKKQQKQPQEKNKILLFGKGIHSKRHLVHEPDGTLLGKWGMKVWGRPKSKQGKDAKRQNAHIARQELRKLLYDQIENKESKIKWGHKLIHYTELYNNTNDDNDCGDNSNNTKRISMTFQKRRSCLAENDENNNESDIVTHISTVLVGADGIRSAVRNQKFGEHISPLRYLDCIVILGITSSPQSSSLTSDGETVFQTADGTTRMYAMPFSKKGFETAGAAQYSTSIHQQKEDQTSFSNVEDETVGKGETMWQLSFPMTEDDAKLLSSKGPSALKKEALVRCGTWHDPIHEMIHTTPDELISGYPVYDRDIMSEELFRNGCTDMGHAREDGTTNTQSNSITLIGDAAHPMSPFKGQGANQALLDAVLLARELHKVFRQWKGRESSNLISRQTLAGYIRLEDALSEFERNMLQRSEGKVKASAEAAKFLHSDVAITKGNITRAEAARQSVDDKKLLTK
jgi:salicylate hydroxylase